MKDKDTQNNESWSREFVVGLSVEPDKIYFYCRRHNVLFVIQWLWWTRRFSLDLNNNICYSGREMCKDLFYFWEWIIAIFAGIIFSMFPLPSY